MITSQRELLAKHSKLYRPDFNPELFRRNTEDIVDEVKKVILSICNRGTYFSIRVVNFDVITDYIQMMNILYDYEERHKNRNKDKTRENKYDYINIKSSEFILLMVTYEISSKDETDTLVVPIAIPRIVEKYYLKLAGNLYLPQLQVVDGSTYNNALSSSRSELVVLKTLSQPIRMYKRSFKLMSRQKEIVEATYFDLYAFSKTTRAFKYLLAEFGLAGTMNFMGLEGIFVHDKEPEYDPNFYVFYNKENARYKKYVSKTDVYIQVSRFLFDNDVVTQNMVMTIIDATTCLESFDQLAGLDFWRVALGSDFRSATVEKGEGVLTSFRGLLDIATRESIHLPPDMKYDIFYMVKWMVCEFSALRAKDNLNILTKKLRVAEYMAALYATKLNNGIYRITDIGKKVTLDNLRKALATDPMCLLGLIPKCSLVGFRNIVTDVDATEVLKFSVKGQSGLGDNSSNSIPMIYRHAHESYPGIVDLNTASATDPGVTGIICPTAQLYDGGFFSEFEEPNFWPSEYAKMLDEYHRLVGIKEGNVIKQSLGVPTDVEEELFVDQMLGITEELITKIRTILEQKSTDGRICPFINIAEDGRIDLEFT